MGTRIFTNCDHCSSSISTQVDADDRTPKATHNEQLKRLRWSIQLFDNDTILAASCPSCSAAMPDGHWIGYGPAAKLFSR